MMSPLSTLHCSWRYLNDAHSTSCLPFIILPDMSIIGKLDPSLRSRQERLGVSECIYLTAFQSSVHIPDSNSSIWSSLFTDILIRRLAMALGPTIGTGLFIGAGQALAVGGPASLLISYAFLSILTYLTTTTVAEVAAHTPARHGALVKNAFRYTTSSLGFAAAMLRWYTLAMFVPYEITTAMVNLGLWTPGPLIAIRLSIITTIIVGCNFLPDRVFRGSEQLCTKIKIGTMVCFLVLALSIGLGGATGHDSWGFQYWKKPGAFHEYPAKGALGKFWGLLQCLLNSSIAFTLAPEMIVHRAEAPEITSSSEIMENTDPTIQASLPKRVTADVATTAFPYILSSVAMGVMAPYDNPLLTNNGAGAGISPFVIGINTAMIRILPVTATVAILISSVASGRSFLYLASRSLCALSELGHAPSMFQARNGWGVPYVAVAVSSLFALFALISVSVSSTVMLTYFLVFVNCSGFISSLVSFAVYRQYRKHPRLRDAHPGHRFTIQPAGAYIGVALSACLLVANGMNGALPGPRAGPRGARLASAYLSVVVFSVLYMAHRLRDNYPQKTQQRFKNDPEHRPGQAHRHHSTHTVRRTPQHVPHQQGEGQRQQHDPSVIEMDQVWSEAVEV